MPNQGVRTTIAPTLSVKDGKKAVEWYKTAFGATELHRADSLDGEIVSQLAVDGAIFFVADESPDDGNPSAERLGATPVRIALIVSDPDAVADRAVTAGATLTYPVADQHYGWRLGAIVDPFGHRWEIGHPL